MEELANQRIASLRVSMMKLTRALPSLAGLLLAASLSPSQPAKSPMPVDRDHAAKMAQGTQVFKQHVRPVLEKTCLRCHGGKETEGELDINTRESLLKGGHSGP